MMNGGDTRVLRTRSDLFRRALDLIPGGVNSPVRAMRAVGLDEPLFVGRGEGAYLEDVDGNRYVDWVMSWGPLIFGHADPETVAAVRAAAERGTSFGAPTEAEVDLAAEIVDAVPSVEKVRLVSSGTEAAMSAARLARAFTARDRILKFAGCYHGHVDALLASAGSGVATLGLPSSPGVPPATTKDTIVCKYNDVDAVASTVAEYGEGLAAIIVEPVAGNMGVVPPEPGFLEVLRRLCDASGALLVFDEVITGFRVARGGAQELFGVLPDITTMAKGLGGGFPVAAIGGSEEVMGFIADGGYSHSGTYNSNVIQAAAVSATMDELAVPGLHGRQRALGTILMDGLEQLAGSAGVPVRVQGLGTAFQMWFSSEPIRNYRDAARYARRDLFRRWWEEMFARGVLFHPSQDENMFVSMVHTREDVDRTLEAAEASLRVVAREV
jgi:glutamate-1-semialdehyde 2,1-aminomutase